MSLQKAIESKKEKRKPYHGAKAVDKQCRNHGDCEWCRENRQHSNKKNLLKYKQTHAPLVQLVRMFALQAEGLRFES